MTSIFWLIALFFLNPMIVISYFRTKEKKLLYSQIFFFIIGIIYTVILNYTFLIDKTWQAFFVWVIPPFVVCNILSSIFTYRNTKSEFKNSDGLFLVVFIAAVFWLVMTFIYPLSIKKDLAKLANAKTVDNKIEDTNIEHIPVIPYSTAKYKGDKVLGKVENYSLYEIGEYNIQKVGSELCWIAPIEFNGFFSYKKAGTVNYYIKISAEYDKPAELVKTEAKYTPSAWFGNNLQRMVRSKYPNILIMGTSLEPDDNGKAYYAVSYGHYSNFRNARVVDGVILFDAATGAMQKYSKENVPKFVDQVVPEDIALDYNTWYGKYSLGLMNYIFTKQGVHIPTQWNGSKEVAGVFTNNNDFYYATDHTNLDEKSTTMVGFSMMSGRTGEFLYYPSIKGINGKAALLVVEKTFQKDQWKGDQPILCSIYGTNTWIIPVIDSTGVFREIALVNAETSKIAHAQTKQEAFEKYRILLATGDQGNITPTNKNFLKNVSGKVIRVINIQTSDGGVQKLLIEGSNKIFSINTDIMPYAVFTKEGDTVELKYIDTNDLINVVKEMKNLSLPIK
ncbi:hypothetical protein [Clostridium sp. DJ247]|uniref:hypothetical protein n=1 Tax=Clostridium sp. DJ247 TaxID=2726188 RepID=UPI00162522C0|nr:hypothetical protein [Clostridium sp. DJ247]MBC2581083.1 hypothetical protein [Clostridium sp. DJ247]